MDGASSGKNGNRIDRIVRVDIGRYRYVIYSVLSFGRGGETMMMVV